MPHTKLGSYNVEFRNSEEFHLLKNEIFTQNHYYFETENPTPFIIDAGAHIGLATLYFKKLYPHARIIAIEPQPQNFQLLENNIFENQLTDITTYQIALAEQAGTQEFYSDNTSLEWLSTAGFLPGSWIGTQSSDQITVQTLPLSHFLTQPVDFLKMDIEGAETNVLLAAADHLSQVKHLMLEFHPHPHQKLTDLHTFLTKRYKNVEVWKKGQPVDVRRATGLVILEAWR
jgi:FkbM family methyltransferase